MGFNNGHAKSGGRKPGTPNRRTYDLIELLNEYDYSPVADLIAFSQIAKENIKTAADPNEAANWVKIGVACAAGLMPYVFPKLKPAEHNAGMTIEELKKLPTTELLDMAEQVLIEHRAKDKAGNP